MVGIYKMMNDVMRNKLTSVFKMSFSSLFVINKYIRPLKISTITELDGQ